MSKDAYGPSGLGRQLVIGIILVDMISGSAIAASNLATSGLVVDPWGCLFRMAYLGTVVANVAVTLIMLGLIWPGCAATARTASRDWERETG
ncbi:hypothetical protein ACFLWA_09170 [Chloroflexota bacterium]